MGEYALIIDRGSTNVKASVWDKLGNEISSFSQASQSPVSLHPNWCEQDMNLMWESAVKAIKGLLKQQVSVDDIKGIFVTGQGNGLMSIDKDGNPARMGILSLDSRAASIRAELVADGRLAQAMKQAPISFVTGSPLLLLLWFQRNAPEEYKKMDKILFSKDWIRYKLSGVICTDQTDASGAGLMNLSQSTHAYDVFNLFGLSDLTDKLPEIRPSHEIVGQVTQAAALETGLREGTPVLCGAHDIGAFPFGIGSLDSKEIISVIGTWGLNLMPTKSNLPVHSLTLFQHTVPGCNLLCAGDGNAGSCLDRMIQLLCEQEKAQCDLAQKSIYQYVENKLSLLEPTGILFHPFIFGSALYGDASSGFYGIRNWHSKLDMVRAVYEGITMGYYLRIQKIPESEAVKRLWLIGGGAKSSFWSQMFADMIGCTVCVPHTKEITARGGAMNAWVGLGIYADHQQACIPPTVAATYQPRTEMNQLYQKKFEIFCDLIQANAAAWEKINKLNQGRSFH